MAVFVHSLAVGAAGSGGALCAFLFMNKKTEVGWRRHLSVGGGSQKGGSGNRPSQENKGYNYQLRVVHERS